MASLVRNMSPTMTARTSANTDDDSLPPFQFLARMPVKAIRNWIYVLNV